MTTTSELTNLYISSRRSIKDCISKGLVNYSALSRLIADDLGLDKRSSKEAILIAARRYAQNFKGSKTNDEAVMEVVRNNELEIKNKVIAVILDKEIYKEHFREFRSKVEGKADLFHAVEGSKTFMVVTADKYLDAIKAVFKRNIIKVSRDLVEIVIKSPPEIESTPGVVGFLVSLFAENEVNIYEIISCWTDTIIVIDEKDLPKTLTFLKL